MKFTLELEQEPPVRVAAEQGDTVLASFLRAGVEFPHDCQAGNCGSCKCELIAGEITELPYSPFALEEEERARDLILACRSQVWSDCVIRQLQQDDNIVHPARLMQCRVAALYALTHDVRALKLEVKNGGPYMFSAGQHAQLEFAAGLSASFSMANRPVDPVLEFHVQRLPGDAASEFVHQRLTVGDPVQVSGPHGQAYLRAQHSGPIVAVAEGRGVAAICSIIETALLYDPARSVRLYLGVRTERDVLCEQRLTQLAAKHPNFSYRIVLSEQGPQLDTPQRAYGPISAVLAQEGASLAGAKAYVAAAPTMTQAVVAYFEQAGLNARDIHTDLLQAQPQSP